MKPGRLTPNKGQKTMVFRRSPGMDEREAETKPGRSRRTDAPEPVETTPGGIDAFPRTSAAGPGCQAATVADGRRKPETDAPRWRKCVSWMQGGLKDGKTKARHRAGGGLEVRPRDAKGRISLHRASLSPFHQIPIK